MTAIGGGCAIVTGGASGIGRGTARAFAAAGAMVAVADINLAGAQETVAEIAAAGGTAAAFACDVAAEAAFDDLRDEVLGRFGRIDIVMNNAGAITRGLPEHVPLAEWRRIMEVNLFSVVRSNLAFLPMLIEQGHGHIVNTASFAGLMSYSYDRLPYSASKAAVIQLSEGLAIYLRPMGIGVTVLCPGPVATGIMSAVREFGPPTDTRGPGPDYRVLSPDEVGTMVVAAVAADRFMLPTHEQVFDVLAERATNWESYVDRQVDSPFVVATAKRDG